MAAIAELPLRYRVFLGAYPFRRLSPVPFSVPVVPLRSATVALVTTGGLSVPEDPPFDEAMKGGDVSFRVIASTANLPSLAFHQRSESFDRAGVVADRNLALPLDRLYEMERTGEIGRVAPRHLSFMGAITAPGRLIRETAPRAVDALVADGVDVALLVPL